MSNPSRRQLMIERLLEDERLRGDLEDAAATALLEWACRRVGAVAGDPARTDEQVEHEVQTLRRATLLAANSGAQAPDQVLAFAEAQLTQVAESLRAHPSATLSAAATEVANDHVDITDDMPTPGRLERVVRVRRSRLAPLIRRLRARG